MWPLVFILQFPQIYYVVCCQDIVLLFFFVVLFTRLPLTVGSALVLLIKSPFDTYIFLTTAATLCCWLASILQKLVAACLSSSSSPPMTSPSFRRHDTSKTLFSRFSSPAGTQPTVTRSFVIPGYVLFATDLVLAVSALRSSPILWNGGRACDWSPLLFPVNSLTSSWPFPGQST